MYNVNAKWSIKHFILHVHVVEYLVFQRNILNDKTEGSP